MLITGASMEYAKEKQSGYQLWISYSLLANCKLNKFELFEWLKNTWILYQTTPKTNFTNLYQAKNNGKTHGNSR
jgi:hypothetical protein